MSFIKEHQREIRLSISVLLVISFFGPWFFDALYIPPENPCPVRLSEDLCGTPVPGLWLIASGLGILVGFIRDLARGTELGLLQFKNFLAGFLILWPILPLLSTLNLVRSGESRIKLIFHWIACLVALGVSLFIGVQMPSFRFWLLWGVWLYSVAIAVMLALELLVPVVSRARPPLPGG